MSKTFDQILHEQMFGYSVGGKEPIQNFIVRDVGSDFRKAIKPLAPEFIKLLKTQATANGLPSEYLNYIWWMLYERSSLLPTLEKKEKTALHLGKNLVAAEYLMPKYDQNFHVPPHELSSNVEAVVKGWAKATKKKFMMDGSKALMTALRKNAPRLKRAYPDKFASNPAAMVTLMGFVNTALFKYASWFTNPAIQNTFVNVLLSVK